MYQRAWYRILLTALTACAIAGVVAQVPSKKREVEPPAPPVYLMPRENLLRPTAQRPPEPVKEGTSEPARPRVQVVASQRPCPPLRPPGPAIPEVPTVPELVPPPVAPAASQPEPATPADAAKPPALPTPAPIELPKEEPPKAVTVAGEYRFVMLAARPGLAGSGGLGQQLNRVRLKVDARAMPALSFHVENDFDLITGSYLRSDEFRSISAGVDVPRQYWSVRAQNTGRHGYQVSSNLYRGYAKLGLDQTDVTFGRQRIALGTGVFWSALDMLNPPNPLRIERDEILGVDAVLVERKLGPLSKASLAYAPDPDRRSSRWVAQYRRNVKESDLTLTYGKYWDDHLVGVDAATQVGNAGLRGEWAYTRPRSGKSFHKVLLAWDYALANSLAFSFEAYYSGQSMQDRVAATVQHPQMRFVQPLGSSYAGMTVGYDFTPLWRASAAILVNARDRSRVLYPSLAYSFSDNLSVLVGSQFFVGGAATEYGAEGDMHLVRVQYYF